MNIIEKIFSKEKKYETHPEENKVLDSVDKAQNVAAIVNRELENGNIDAINDKLLVLSIKDEREKYVFDRMPFTASVITIISCVILTVVFGICLGFCSLIIDYSVEYSRYGLIGVGCSVAIIVLNILLLVISIRRISFCKRYDKYCSLLKYKNIEITDDIAVFAKVTTSIVIKDLNRAIKLKFIPQGHFGKDNLIFITSDLTFSKYNEKQAIYDRYYRKLVEERARMKERTKDMQQIMDLGQKYIDKIHDSNSLIKDRSISDKLAKMEDIVAMIFHEVDINPNQTEKLGMFINYYLPTTEKLLETYIDLDEKGIKGKSLLKAQKDIEGVLDTINNAFEDILDQFYREKEIDIASDIRAMEIMMKQEGIN